MLARADGNGVRITSNQEEPMKTIRSIRPGTVVAVIALLVAMTGSAVAGSAITGKKIKDSSITGKDIKSNTITGDDVNEGTLELPKGEQGPQGPQGPAGPAGAPGASAAKSYAEVDADGNLIAARSKGIESATRTGTGAYRVFPTVPTAGCNAVATTTSAGIARIRAIDNTGENANSVLINTYSLVDGSSFTTNTIQDRGFMVQIAC
jgi:hypothetical protein